MNFFKSTGLGSKSRSAGSAAPPSKDYWGVEADPSPPMTAAAPSMSAAPPGMRLLDLLKPVFTYACELNQLFRSEEKNRVLPDFDAVQGNVEALLEKIGDKALHDPDLNNQYQQFKKPLQYYLDYTFTDPNESSLFAKQRFPFAKQWLKEPLAAVGEGGNKAGSQLFYDCLDEELKSDPNNAAANERLLCYYQCLGLGFLGFFFRPTDRPRLTGYMDKLHSRLTLARLLENSTAAGLLSSENSLHVNKRDLPALVKEKPLIILAATILLLATLCLGYFCLYDMVTRDLHHVVKNIQGGSTESAAAPPAD